jgi:DNA-binding transcriptional LysR family regulator
MRRLQAMELFASAVREGSLSAAGRRAGLSPASVSRQIAALEASLNVQLLNRTSRTLTLTDAGREYLTRLEPILQNIAEAEGAAAALQVTPRGTLRVHSRLMFGMRVVAPIIPAFQGRYPDLRVELRLTEHPARMAEDEVDIDLRLSPSGDTQLMQRRLLRCERVLVASPGYVARMPPVGTPRDLRAQHCLTYWHGPDDVVWRFLDNGVLEELTIAARFTSNNGEVLREMALAGHGIAMLDDYTVSADLAAGRLTRVLPQLRATNTGFDLGVYAVFRRSILMPAKTRVFIDFLAATVQGGAAVQH